MVGNDCTGVHGTVLFRHDCLKDGPNFIDKLMQTRVEKHCCEVCWQSPDFNSKTILFGHMNKVWSSFSVPNFSIQIYQITRRNAWHASWMGQNRFLVNVKDLRGNCLPSFIAICMVAPEILWPVSQWGLAFINMEKMIIQHS